MLMKLLHCINYLARQGLPFCGHHKDIESFQGNLYQLLLIQPGHTLWNVICTCTCALDYRSVLRTAARLST